MITTGAPAAAVSTTTSETIVLSGFVIPFGDRLMFIQSASQHTATLAIKTTTHTAILTPQTPGSTGFGVVLGPTPADFRVPGASLIPAFTVPLIPPLTGGLFLATGVHSNILLLGHP
ncbi:MAG TPA: hypothetical protein VE690_15170 [Rhodopila sp.]|nr:hypothetical protein [Rhodopila sp.]